MNKYMIMRGTVQMGVKGKSSDEVMQKYFDWSQKLRDSGRLLVAHKLADEGGRRLSSQSGRIVDGPYVESKESIGGFYLIEAESLEEAAKIGQEWPWLAEQGGFVEVRQIDI